LVEKGSVENMRAEEEKQVKEKKPKTRRFQEGKKF
jgi:hypothetical protein